MPVDLPDTIEVLFTPSILSELSQFMAQQEVRDELDESVEMVVSEALRALDESVEQNEQLQQLVQVECFMPVDF